MFGIFMVFALLSIVCVVVGAALVALLSYKHEGIDSEYYDYKTKHSTF